LIELSAQNDSVFLLNVCSNTGTLSAMPMIPWTAAQHAQMHWRPDAVIKTSVIEPMWIRQVSPVDMARHTIDPFIASVRGPGPAVSPYPSPEDVAYAAGKLAQLFARGRKGIVCMGAEKITVAPDQLPIGGVVGLIVQAAQELARGGRVAIQIGGRQLIVCAPPGGEPQVTSTPTPPAAPAAATGVRAEVAPPVPAQTSVAVRSTPMTVEQQKKSELGAPKMADTVLPTPIPAGHVPKFPYFDYAAAYRRLYYGDNVWARRNFQAKLAAKFAPRAIAQMHAANRTPVQYARAQVAPALASRPPMVKQRWPHPEAVWPRNVSIPVRKEQR
jgi:hypothetical protein